jgi:uncharacterized protein
MKKYWILIIVLLLAFNSLYSQDFFSGFANVSINQKDSSGLKQGVWMLRYASNENIHAMSTYKNDTLHGNYFIFYENGRIKTWMEYNMGLLWNTRMYCDTSGNMLDPGNVSNGNGIRNAYLLDTLKGNNERIVSLPYPNNQINFSCTYKNGIIDGVTKFYYRDGTLECEGYEKGDRNKIIEETLSYFWEESGKEEVKTIYAFPSKTGIWKYYTEKGKLYKKDIFDDEGNYIKTKEY